MNEHRIPRASLHEDLISLRKEGEEVVSITLEGDRYLVITKPIGIEYRKLRDGAAGTITREHFRAEWKIDGEAS